MELERKDYVIMALCVLAANRSKSDQKVGACVFSDSSPESTAIVSVGYNGMPNGVGFKDSEIHSAVRSGSDTDPETSLKEYMCHAVMNAIVSANRRQADLTQCSIYCTLTPCDECDKLILLSGIKKTCYLKCVEWDDTSGTKLDKFEQFSCPQNAPPIIVDLRKLYAFTETEKDHVEEYRKEDNVEVVKVEKEGTITEEKKKEKPEFPLDDYFMAIAVLSGRFSGGSYKGTVGSCIVSEDLPRVVSVGFNAPISGKAAKHCAERYAISSAYRFRADLTKCTLYTTKYPCIECTKVIVQAGIKVVVCGEKKDQEDDIVYRSKSCFTQYQRHIKTKKRQLKIYLPNCEVEMDRMEIEEIVEKSSRKRKRDESTETLETKEAIVKKSPRKETEETIDSRSPSGPTPYCPKDKPTYKDFFMAMAFLACTRSKDHKTQVGACIVTPYPHRMVSLGYNGMPDGRGFKDVEMKWDRQKEHYVCHAEMNTIISAFRRLADLSACTLYVTHSPCSACSKLVAQAGIKNVIFTKEYHEAKDVYNHLGTLPDMNITQYKYHACGQKNISKNKIRIDLDKLKGELVDSTAEEPEHKELVSQMRDVDFPLDDYFMALAILATTRSGSPDPVGACIVLENPRRAISVGYNGLPDARKNSSGKQDTSYECCAEANAIVSAFRYHADLTASILYTTSQPCFKCAQMIVQSGIRTVVHGGREGDTNATASEGDTNATASEGDTNATASEGDTNATASEGDTNATASEGDTNATASEGDTNATASEGDTNATASEGDTNATASEGDTNATASEGDTNATASEEDMNATVSEIFYRAKTAYLKYKHHSMRFIDIDLQGQTVKQTDT